jgi:acyl dehydratase
VTAASAAAGQDLPALEVDVTARTIVMGASASRDWQPQHHDHAWATGRAGTRDIFLNTPAQAGWIERYLTDWTGPRGRLGRMRFRMRRSVVPGDRLVFSGRVDEVGDDDAGCRWAFVSITISVGDERVTECTARIAVPSDDDDNPWDRRGEAWRP